MTANDDNLIAGYLLGDLSEEERNQVEERLFTDSLFFQKIEVARDQLIEDYLSGRLANTEREKFESHFLASPSRRERVETTMTLMQIANRANPVSAITPVFHTKSIATKNLLRNLLLVAAVLIVLIGGALLMHSSRLQNRLDQLEIERATLERKKKELQQHLEERRAMDEQLTEQLRLEREERQRLEQEMAALKTGKQSDSTQSLIASLTLSPLLVREESKTPLLKLAPPVTEARLRVNLDAPDYITYRATLETVEGKRVWQQARLQAAGKSLTLHIPARLLSEADYLLTITGIPSQGAAEEIGKYYFRVVRK